MQFSLSFGYYAGCLSNGDDEEEDMERCICVHVHMTGCGIFSSNNIST